MARYPVISLDGGGIRGLLSVILLERLVQARPELLDRIQLAAGVSTGGLLALGLAAGKTPAYMRRLYEVDGHKVFADSLWDDIRDLGHMTGAEYSLEPLRERLQDQFGELTLADLPKRVLVAAFDLDCDPLCSDAGQRAWKAKFFHNYPCPQAEIARRVVDVGLYTVAAPTYFPVRDGFIDGGVVVSNPSMCALAQALHPPTGGQQLEDVVLLSLGTGKNPHYLEVEQGDWGLGQWAPHLVTLMLEGGAGLVDYQCRQIMGERYHRLNPLLAYEIAPDAVDKIPQLQAIAAAYDLRETLAWLDAFWM